MSINKDFRDYKSFLMGSYKSPSKVKLFIDVGAVVVAPVAQMIWAAPVIELAVKQPTKMHVDGALLAGGFALATAAISYTIITYSAQLRRYRQGLEQPKF